MKTITVIQGETEYTIHLDRFAEDAKHIQQTREFGSTWSHTWLRAGLITFQENGDVSLTPRGEDLLASLPFLPVAQKPATSVTPCSKCNGTGEQPLFVSMETCDRCEGSKIEPIEPRLGYNAILSSVTVHDEIKISFREIVEADLNRMMDHIVFRPSGGIQIAPLLATRFRPL